MVSIAVCWNQLNVMQWSSMKKPMQLNAMQPELVLSIVCALRPFCPSQGISGTLQTTPQRPRVRELMTFPFWLRRLDHRFQRFRGGRQPSRAVSEGLPALQHPARASSKNWWKECQGPSSIEFLPHARRLNKPHEGGRLIKVTHTHSL